MSLIGLRNINRTAKMGLENMHRNNGDDGTAIAVIILILIVVIGVFISKC